MNLSKIIYNWCFCVQKIGLLVKKISESHEICVIQRKEKEIGLAEKHKPHTIREIYHPQKNQ